MTSRTLTEIAELCGADLEGDGAREVVGPSSLVDAQENHISFFSDPRYKAQLAATQAAGVLVPSGFELDDELRRELSGPGRKDLTLLKVEDPSGAFTTVIESFVVPITPLPVGVDPSARVDATAKLGADVAIGPHVVIGPSAVIGDRVCLHAGVYVGEAVELGEDTVCHPNVTLYPRSILGKRCLLHAGVVIGSDGFGFNPTAEGWDKIPQCGSVLVEDDVEMGAGSTVDRGRFGATRIGRGSKFDNLVHVAHNVVIGEATLLCAQVGIAGSSTLGKRVIMGGQAGAGGHLSIADGVSVGGGGGVIGDITERGEYLGWPARPRRETFKRIAAQSKVPELMKRLRSLEDRLEKLEGDSS